MAEVDAAANVQPTATPQAPALLVALGRMHKRLYDLLTAHQTQVGLGVLADISQHCARLTAYLTEVHGHVSEKTLVRPRLGT